MSPIQNIIFQLGGYRNVAALMRKPLTTVQYWWDKSVIPDKHKPDVLALAKEQGIEINPLDLFMLPPKKSKKTKSN